MGNRTYIAIDLKSFYASVECRERGLDPLTTNLVVADVSRTEKTICLAVSPMRRTIAMKMQTFDSYKELYQKLDLYEEQKAKVYSYLLSAATDGAVSPLSPRMKDSNDVQF